MTDRRIYEIGARVRLNSGGPLMTVVDYNGHKLVCSWRDQYNVVQEYPFLPECVTREHSTRKPNE